MRIEKVNENQIRCFLTREDMERRRIRLKELAYGTEKARLLFHELMERAYRQYGFSAENTPVMVEAIPMFDESLVLNITRVENPEELDTRFSSFAPSVRSGSADTGTSEPSALGQLLDSIRHDLAQDSGNAGDRKGKSGSRSAKKGPADTHSGKGESADSRTAGPAASSGQSAVPEQQLFTFRSLLEASAAAAAARDYLGASSLYRDPADARYYLFLRPDPASDKAAFGRQLSAFSEFGISEYITPAREQHLREHCENLCASEAVRKLAALGQD